MLLISMSSTSKSSPALCCWTPFTMRMALGLTDLPWWVTLWITSPPGESPSAVAGVSAIPHLPCPTSCPITSFTEPSAPIQHHLEPFSSATASNITAVRHNWSKSLKISFNNVLLPPLFFLRLFLSCGATRCKTLQHLRLQLLWKTSTDGDVIGKSAPGLHISSPTWTH